jgi:hypothetical protein
MSAATCGSHAPCAARCGALRQRLIARTFFRAVYEASAFTPVLINAHDRDKTTPGLHFGTLAKRVSAPVPFLAAPKTEAGRGGAGCSGPCLRLTRQLSRLSHSRLTGSFAGRPRKDSGRTSPRGAATTGAAAAVYHQVALHLISLMALLSAMAPPTRLPMR